ncbi:MAG: hypothetical protein QXJ74_06225 [Nitrososphaera sp.]|uniref:hypothetical protein n=1 Tax=Nitrososphaera sp. TaxID=1971748 RepID=UPI0017E8940C|nr:hypothetical protein [Nitrososphaera sp.]NWG36002.1 hypothetical protein [Nitrososphaera sp.]
MPDAEYDQFCQELVDLDESMVAAFVLSNGIRGSHIKLDVPVLKEEDAQRLSRQTATVMDIVKSNERLFGEVGFVLVRHESVDGMFFPVDSSTTVLVGLVRPYDQDEIEQAVRAKIEEGLAKKAVDSI